MKIGIDVRLWSESGVGRYIRNLVYNLALVDKKNNYTLFVLKKDIGSIKNLPGNFRIVSSEIRWHSVSEQLFFSSLIEKENLDLVHFPYFSVPIRYKGPFVVTIHDLIINHFPTGKASTLSIGKYAIKLMGYNFIIRQAVKKARKIITVSKSTEDEIISHLKVSSDKIVVTPEAVDPDFENNKPLSQQERQSLEKFLLFPYFLYVGNAYPHKNLEKLISVFSMLGDKAKDARLILVGKDDYFYGRLKQMVNDLKLSKRIIFLSDVDDRKLSFLYSHAKALVLPSLMEGFGLPALEAMSRNCLVVCSDIPSLRHLCGYAAVYFDPRKSSDIMKKLQTVYGFSRNDIKTNLLQGKTLSKKYSWQKLAKQTLNAYESCFGI